MTPEEIALEESQYQKIEDQSIFSLLAYDYSIDAYGGVVSNGESIVVSVYNETGSGGVISSGQAIFVYNETGSGGVISSGQAISVYNEVGSGGSVLGGQAIDDVILQLRLLLEIDPTSILESETSTLTVTRSGGGIETTSTLWGGLVARYCPSLDNTGNGTTTLYNLDGDGNQIGSNNGTLTNMDATTDWVADTDSGGTRAIEFDGVNDYVASTLSIAPPLTMSCFVKLDTLAVNQYFIQFSKVNGISTEQRARGILWRSTGQITAVTQNNNENSLVDFSITPTDWVHVAATFSRSGSNETVELFVNGASVGTNTSIVTDPSTSVFRMGAGFRDNNDLIVPLNGKLDDICIFNEAKSDADIAQLASQRGLVPINTSVDELTIDLSSTNTGVATVPATITILQDATFITTTVTSVGDGTTDLQASYSDVESNIETLSVLSVYNETSFGGSVAGGESFDATFVNEDVSDGIVLGGESFNISISEEVGFGSIELSGESFNISNSNKISSGGAESGGESLNSLVLIEEISGGISVGGGLTITSNEIEEISGGISVGGESFNSSGSDAVSSGGIELGGESLNSLVLVEDIYGGIELGGESLSTSGSDAVSSGGIELGGLSSNVSNLNDFGSGGISVGGESLNSFVSEDVVFGILIGGESLGIIFVNENISGGISIDGESSNAIFANEEIAGGISIDGESSNAIFVNEEIAGGIGVDGESLNFLILEDISSGGIELGGESLNSLVLIENVSGGIVIGGVSFNSSILNEISDDGIELGGVSEEFVEYKFIVSQDGFWTSSGLIDFDDDFVYIGDRSTLGFGEVQSFFRFSNITIPSGSKILSAYLKLETGGDSSGTVSARLYLNAIDNAILPTTAFEADSLNLTSPSVLWDITEAGAGILSTSPDISAIIQEIVDRPGWINGYSLMIVASPSDELGIQSTQLSAQATDEYQTFASNENTTYDSASLFVVYRTIENYSEEGYGGLVGLGVVQGYLISDEFPIGGIALGGESILNAKENFLGDGGILLSGTLDYFVNRDLLSIGGALVSSSSIIDSIIEEEFLGGVNVGGESALSAKERFLGEGGVLLSGTLDYFVNRDLSSIGGALVGSTSIIDSIIEEESLGGVNVGGNAFVESGIQSLGGTTVGSSALVTFYDSVEEVLDGEGVQVGGNATLQTFNVFRTDGGITVSGSSVYGINLKFVSSGLSSDAPPNFSGITIGYRNSENPTIVDFKFEFDTICNWGVNKTISIDTGIYWNTGRLPLYFYRIVGKPQFIDECDPIEGIGDCCKQFILNISARSISDLCERLRKRRWKWPIKTVERFSRNAENALIQPEDEDCNTLTPVEICNNIICEEFCIDYDVKDVWGYSSKTQFDAFKKYSAQGVVYTSGAAIVSLDVNSDLAYSSTGGLEVSGTGVYLSSLIGSLGGVRLGGVARLQSSSWYYNGGEWPSIEDGLPTTTDQFSEGNNDQDWVDIDNVKSSNDLRAYVDTTNGASTKYLVVKGFEFDIPSNGIILGIEADIERHSTGSVRESAVYLVVGDEIVSDNMASWPYDFPIGVDSVKTYGGINNLWRNLDDIEYLGDWSISDINNPEFGLAIRVEANSNQLVSETRIDSIRLRVYWELEGQHLSVSGNSSVLGENYHYESNGLLVLNGGSTTPIITYNYISEGRGLMGPGFAGITLSGTYVNSIIVNTSGGLEIGGSSQIGQFGVSLSGFARVGSTRNFYSSEGELTLQTQTGLYQYNANYIPTGNIIVSGTSGINNSFRWVPTGSLQLGGTSSLKSNAFNFKSDGNVLFVLGESSISFGTIGTVEINIGFTTEVLDIVIQFPPESVEIDTVPNDVINACQCTEMDLIMPMLHNFNNGNKLTQFLNRNNYTMSRVLGLKWSRVNESWISNQSFEGFGSNTPDKEIWTIISQLQCTNNVGGAVLDSNVWRFSLQVIQKNLRTFADFDTRLVVSFIPDLVCSGGRFSVEIDIDTQLDYISLEPESTIYDFKLYDNIGLFKSQYWILNPNLRFQLSQTGVDELVARYPLYI